MKRKVLVVGGTGPSGPYVLQGLLERGYDVTILHRGVHEPDDLPDVRHIHADPHFAEQLAPALHDEEFDTVIAMYGRLKMQAEVFAGRCDRFMAVGARIIYDGYIDPASTFPRGMRLMATEESALADPSRIADERARRFAARMLAAENAVFSRHERGAYRATLLRYPYIYSPRATATIERSVIQRVRDGRSFIALPNLGLGITSRCAAENAAHCLLLALDNEAAFGEVFNCADEDQYSLAQWVELIAAAAGSRLEVVDVPAALRWTMTHLLLYAGSAADHAIADISKARSLLGYGDVIRAPDALAATVRWHLEHPSDPRQEPAFPDRFDYAMEDRIRDEMRALAARFEPLRVTQEAVHAYAHPKKPSLTADHRGR